MDPRQHGGEEPWHAVLGLEPEELDEGDDREQEGERDGAAGDEADRPLPVAALERRAAERQHGRPREREERDQRHVRRGSRYLVHPRSRSVASTSIVSKRW